MIVDAQARLFNAQAITAAGTYTSNSYDVQLNANTPIRNIGRGQPLRLVVTADVAFAGGTNLTINYVDSPNADLSGATVRSSTVITGSPTTGQKLLDVHVPQNLQRYVGLTVVSTGTYTAGTLSAHLVSDTNSDTYYTANTGF